MKINANGEKYSRRTSACHQNDRVGSVKPSPTRCRSSDHGPVAPSRCHAPKHVTGAKLTRPILGLAY